MNGVEIAQLVGAALGAGFAAWAAKRAGSGKTESSAVREGLSTFAEALRQDIREFRRDVTREIAELRVRIERLERRNGLGAWSPPDGTPAQRDSQVPAE